MAFSKVSFPNKQGIQFNGYRFRVYIEDSVYEKLSTLTSALNESNSQVINRAIELLAEKYENN